MTLSRLEVLVIALVVAAPLGSWAATHSSDELPSAQVAGALGRDPVTAKEADIADSSAKAGDPVIKPIVEERPAAPPRQFPAVEFFVGYSYANLNLGSQSNVFVPAGRSYNGGEIDAKFNLRKNVALFFNFAQQSGNSKISDPLGFETHMELDATQFLAGPEFTLRTHKFNAFAHTLFGLTHTSLNVLNGYFCYDCSSYTSVATRTNLAFGAGGGIERNWRKHFAFRLFQADYIPTRLDGKWEGHFRIGTGLIMKF